MRFFKKYVLILGGALFLSSGINCFFIPQRISTGGLSTIATLLYILFKIPLSVSTVVLNALLFIPALIILGKSKVFSTVISIIFYAVFLELTENLPIYQGDALVSAFSGACLTGTGIGLLLKAGSSSGGSDLIAMMLNKRFPHLKVTRLILLTDFTIVLLSAIVFDSFTVLVYSVVSLILSLKIAEAVLAFGESTSTVYIFSQKSKKISDVLTNELHKGVTGFFAQGMYSKEPLTVLLCASSRRDVSEIIDRVSQEDPDAFLIINDAHTILGRGFKSF